MLAWLRPAVSMEYRHRPHVVSPPGIVHVVRRGTAVVVAMTLEATLWGPARVGVVARERVHHDPFHGLRARNAI